MMLKNLKSSDIPNVRREILEYQGYQHGRIRNFDKFEN